MTILVPIDETEESLAGLREAAREARAQGDTIVIATVGELAETSEHADEERRDLAELLDRAAATVTDVPIKKRLDMAGDPVRGILEVASDEGADRIVIASPHRGLFAELGHRSISDELSKESSIPVTVIDAKSES